MSEPFVPPRLKRNELTRDAKRAQLERYKMSREDREKLLDKLYGPEVPSSLVKQKEGPL